MPTTLLNFSSNLVTMGNVFSSSNYYLYKSSFSESSIGRVFTSTLYNSTLEIYKETTEGYYITNFTQIPFRESLPPDVPTRGPFIEDYSKEGSLNTDTFVNLLLIDKPPIRTGYFDFTIGPYTFPGFITKQTPYKHYNWQFAGSKYTYVEQSVDLGYGIEISRNLLWTAFDLGGGSYRLEPTPLRNYLLSLNGSEEITSAAASTDPNSYLNPIQGLTNASATTLLPISLYYISPADALRYIASYPNLIETVGADSVRGQELYAENGGTITFDPIAYLNKYADIRALYGYDTLSATIHYITTGYYQGRTLDNSSVFNSLTGGLYDERTGSIVTSNINAILPLGQTLASTGSSITYDYNTQQHYLNASVPVQSNTLYLGIH